VILDADRPFALYADGEPAGHLPVRLSVEPHALLVVGP
jgi:diacylglycerol kinase family enzyme